MTQNFEQPETAEKPDASPDDRWKGDLHKTDRGEFRDVQINVAIILRKDNRFRGRLRWNALLEAVEARELPWRKGARWEAWTDADDLQLTQWCQHRHVYVKQRTCAAAVQVVARDRTVHPVRNRLSTLEWDGQERLSGWLATYLGVEIEPGRERYIEAVGRCWTIAAVARVFRPGCKVDAALILEGPQGSRKSTAAATLAIEPEWFADEIADLGSKDSAQDLRGKWIIELGELSAMKRGAVERVKAFMSRRTDHYRPSYGVRSQDFDRQCVFIGTTNENEYLQDHTGNRRFWPVKVGRVDVEALERDRDQLWAEAVAAFRAGEQWWLDPEVEREARAVQEDRRIVDAWEAPVLAWLRGKTEASVADVLTNAIDMDIDRQDRGAQMRIVQIFKAFGWERHRSSAEGRPWIYRRPAPVSQPSSQPEPEMSQPLGQEKPSNGAACPNRPICPNGFAHTHTRAQTRGPKENDGTGWDGWDIVENKGVFEGGGWDKVGTVPTDDGPATEKSPHAHWLSMFQGADTDAKKRTIVETWVRKHGGRVDKDGRFLIVPASLKGPERTALLRLAQEAGLRVPS